MIDTLKIFDELKESMEASVAKKIAEVIGKVYDELQNTVNKEEFNELKDIVKELAEAQKGTEKSLENFKKETANNFNRVWKAIEELTLAQERTEQEIRELTKALNKTRTMVGGLSDAVGYGLEDRAIKSLPGVLKSKYNIEIISPLVRKYVRYNGTRDELNIYGTGKKGKKELFIIGEAKARLSKKHIDSFFKLVQRLETSKIITGDSFLLMVTYSAEPEIEEYAGNKGIKVIWSFEV